MGLKKNTFRPLLLVQHLIALDAKKQKKKNPVLGLDRFYIHITEPFEVTVALISEETLSDLCHNLCLFYGAPVTISPGFIPMFACSGDFSKNS